MTLVARVVFLVLVGATFSAFFVAQRLKSAPPVVNVNRLDRLCSAQRRRQLGTSTTSGRVQGRRRRHGRPSTSAGGGSGVWPRRCRRARSGRCGCSGTAGPTTACAPRTACIACASRRRVGRSVVVPSVDHPRHAAPRPVVVRIRPAGGRPAQKGPAIVASGQHVRNHRRAGQPLPPDEVRRVAHRRRAAAGRIIRVAAQGRGADLGRPGERRPLATGTYMVVPRSRTGPATAAARRRSSQLGERPRRPGLPVRGLAAQPPLGRSTAGGRIEFLVDSRGRDYRWRVRRIGESPSAQEGQRAEPVDSSSARRGACRACTCSRCAPAAGARRCRSSSRPSAPRCSSSSRRSAGSAPTPSTTAVDGLPNTLADGGKVRWPRAVGERAAAGFAEKSPRCWCSWTAGRSATTSPGTSSSTSRATRAPPTAKACCSPARERWVTRSLGRRLRHYVSDGGQARRLRRGHAAPRRAAARRDESRHALAPDAARRGRPVRRARREAAAAPAPADAHPYDGRAGRSA